MKDEEGKSWAEIDALFPNVKRETLRSRYRRAKPPTCKATGVVAHEPPDEDKVYQRALAEWERTRKLEERRANQSLEFSHGPVAIVFDEGTRSMTGFNNLEMAARFMRSLYER